MQSDAYTLLRLLSQYPHNPLDRLLRSPDPDLDLVLAQELDPVCFSRPLIIPNPHIHESDLVLFNHHFTSFFVVG